MGYEVIKILKEYGIVEKSEEEGEAKTLIDYKYSHGITVHCNDHFIL